MAALRVRGPVQTLLALLLPLPSQQLGQLLLPRQPRVVPAPSRLRSGERGVATGAAGIRPRPPQTPPRLAPPLALLSQRRGPGAPRPLTSTGSHICCSTTELGTQPGKRMGRRQYCRWSTAGQVEGLDSTCPRDHAGRAPPPPAQLCPPDVQELSGAHTPCPRHTDRKRESLEIRPKGRQ